MRRFGGEKPVDKRVLFCPQCKKLCMTRPIGHVVSLEKQEFKTRDNQSVLLFVDTCEKCVGKNYRKYFEPTRSDVRKILKAMNTDEASDVSLEELL